MTPVIERLLELLDLIQPAPGTSPEAFGDMLRAEAANIIQQDPAQAQIPPGEFDPRIVDAIKAGAEQAAALKAAGKRLRLDTEDLPVGTAAPNRAERPTEIFAPFVEKSGRLGRLVAFESSAFLKVNVRLPGQQTGPLWLLIPASSASDAPDLRKWTLPAGTVWIRAAFLAKDAPGFAGLRIAGGTLEFDRQVTRLGGIRAPLGTVWTLSLEPEKSSPGAAGGSDADALNLRLPANLLVRSNAGPVLTGDLALSGFGSDLNLTPSGAVFVGDNQISFPLQAAEPRWFIAGNRSKVTQFSGESEPLSPLWAIPTSVTPPEQLGEAAHGGSILVSFSAGLRSTFAAQDGGPFQWFATTLTANAARIELQSVQPNSGARYDFALWETSVSELRFAGQPISRLFFGSERGGLDGAAAFGGLCVNRWDLPRAADGTALDFKGSIGVFGLVSTPNSFFMTMVAGASVEPKLAGLALQNLYILVPQPERLALLAPFNTAPTLGSGKAALVFDVIAAIPTLPDPYASNLTPPDSDHIAFRALRVELQWTDSKTAQLLAHFDEEVRFPEPRFQQLDDDDERAVYESFKDHLQSQPEFLYLLDLSSREHLFGVAFESPSDIRPIIKDNLLSLQLNRIRLLMQPQVQWEPVSIEPNPNVPTLVPEIANSKWNGGPTLLGANSVKLVPVLAGALSDEIVTAIHSERPGAALFSLPFGLRAMARLDFRSLDEDFLSRTFTLLNEPAFGDFTSARQVRLIAVGRTAFPNPARVMPGKMRQLRNLAPNLSGLTSVIPNELRDAVNNGFRGIPLHHADLSGYGLSTFSEWHQDLEGANFTKVEFRVLNGRTAYEVIQFRSVLYECGARTVRTVILERHNNGRVLRVDTGWVAIEPGLFTRPVKFANGAVFAFENIRRIRIVGAVLDVDGNSAVQPVVFDADARIAGAIGGTTPIYDRPGYIQVKPPLPPPAPPPQATPAELTDFQVMVMFGKVGGAISSPIDCAVRIAGTLDAQISSIVSQVALDDANGIGFAVAIVGSPKLPNAGQWTFVRVARSTQETSPVESSRGVPIVCNLNGPFRFREPADARRTNGSIEYSLLMATETSRVLFPLPKLDPDQPGKMLFDAPPVLADPYSLVQSKGAFPSRGFGLQTGVTPSFEITENNLWRMDKEAFPIAIKPVRDLMKGSGWGINRDYEAGGIQLKIDSGAATPFDLEAPVSVLNLEIPGLGDIFQIRTQYQNVAGGIPKLAKPDLIFLGALDELKETLDSLAHLLGLEFPFDVSVTSGTGPSPSFVVHMNLIFRIGGGPDGRVDIGLGKFYGQFLARGELEAAMTGVERALLFVEFQGDVQQGILPPLLYAGGLFRFSIELRETGDPVIQLTLGVVISIGGDLIPGLLAVEVTVKYGYTLIPKTFEPGILLGLEARAKLLAGLIGFSFSVEAMARMKRSDDGTIVTIRAQIRVAATVQIAIFFEEEVDFETQFQQDLPLAALALVPGVGMAVLPAAIPL